MDPNAALKDIISMLDAVNSADEDVPVNEVISVYSFIESVSGLVEWLNKGGFLPEAWQPKVVKSLISEMHDFIGKQEIDEYGEPQCGYAEFDETVTDYARDITEAVEAWLQ